MWNQLRRLTGRFSPQPYGFPFGEDHPRYDCHLMLQAYLEPLGRRAHFWIPADQLWQDEGG